MHGFEGGSARGAAVRVGGEQGVLRVRLKRVRRRVLKFVGIEGWVGLENLVGGIIGWWL